MTIDEIKVHLDKSNIDFDTLIELTGYLKKFQKIEQIMKGIPYGLMRVSIDKAVDRLEDLCFEQDNWEYEELTEDCFLNKEALRLAIETMRKYQKIEKIIHDDWIKGVNSGATLNKIEEVLEDGND